MRIKHITFSAVDRKAWERSQRIWLERSIASGGLVEAYGAASGTDARAVFHWADDEALASFMERSHDAALEAAGAVGRYAVLHLQPITVLAVAPIPRAYMGETIAWVKDHGIEIWLESQRAWNDALQTADGFAGGMVARGRQAFVVTSFWRDEASHERYERVDVPRLRSTTRGDEQTARLLRFHGPLVPSLAHVASHG